MSGFSCIIDNLNGTYSVAVDFETIFTGTKEQCDDLIKTL